MPGLLCDPATEFPYPGVREPSGVLFLDRLTVLLEEDGFPQDGGMITPPQGWEGGWVFVELVHVGEDLVQCVFCLW